MITIKWKLFGSILAVSVIALGDVSGVAFADDYTGIDGSLTPEEEAEMAEKELMKETLVTEKESLPKDTRPEPQSEEDWDKLAQMDDPLATESVDEVSAQANIPWSVFAWGDVILGRGASSSHSIPYGYYRHAGTWHNDKKRLVSAMPGDGVRWEYQTTWNTKYPKAAAVYVPKASYTKRKTATKYTENQLGEPYKLSAKSVSYSWYCSKLPWAGYKGQGYDIDANGGYYVTPDNIYDDGNTRRFFER